MTGVVEPTLGSATAPKAEASAAGVFAGRRRRTKPLLNSCGHTPAAPLGGSSGHRLHPHKPPADEEDATSQVSAVTPGRTEAAARGRHLRSPSSGASSAAGSLGSRPDAQQPVALAARAQEMEAVVAAAKEQAFREQRHRHTASMSALREEQAALERAKRELESCLIAARNQAALLQASQREESGEGAQCWEQVGTGLGEASWGGRLLPQLLYQGQRESLPAQPTRLAACAPALPVWPLHGASSAALISLTTFPRTVQPHAVHASQLCAPNASLAATAFTPDLAGCCCAGCGRGGGTHRSCPNGCDGRV